MSDYAVEPAAPDVAPAVEAPQVEAPAEPAWSVSQDEWQATQEALGYLVQQIAPPQDRPSFDPLSDNADEQLRSIIREELAPYQQFQQQAQLGEAEARAKDMLTDIQARDGEFLLPDSAEKARVLANSLVQEAAQKHGFGPKAAEAALTQAYKTVREWEDAVGKAYHDRQMNQLRGLSGAPREPAAAGGSVQQVTVPGGGTEMDVVRHYLGG